MLLTALIVLQLVQHPMPMAKSAPLSNRSYEQRRHFRFMYNPALFGQISTCADRLRSFDPYDSSLEEQLSVTMRLAPDGQLIGEPRVNTIRTNLSESVDVSRPEIEAFFNDCGPYPAFSPDEFSGDGSRVVSVTLPIEL